MKFRNNRQLEEKKIEQEVTDEWEKKLQMLTEKYEDDLKRKKDKNLERVKKTKCFRFVDNSILHLGINHSF
jgi:ribosomal protein S13